MKTANEQFAIDNNMDFETLQRFLEQVVTDIKAAGTEQSAENVHAAVINRFDINGKVIEHCKENKESFSELVFSIM